MLFSGIVGIIGLVGFWKMKKWGVYTYSIAYLVTLLQGMIYKVPFNLGYVVPLFFIFVGYIKIVQK